MYFSYIFTITFRQAARTSSENSMAVKLIPKIKRMIEAIFLPYRKEIFIFLRKRYRLMTLRILKS